MQRDPHDHGPRGELRPVFVLSTGRCGSTLLSSMLRAHPDILSLSEFFSVLGGPSAFSAPILPADALWHLLTSANSDLRWLLAHDAIPEVLAKSARGGSALSDVPPIALVTLPHLTETPLQLLEELRARVMLAGSARAEQHFDAVFNWLRVRLERRVWVERSGGSIEYAELLRAGWPSAKFIHLVRDGRDTAYSMAHHPMFRVRLARLLSGSPDLSAERCLRAEIPYHRFGAYWSALILKARRILAAQAAQDVLVLRYEQLTREPDATLDRLATFVTGARAPSAWLAQSRELIDHRPSRWRALPVLERLEFERSCKPGLRCLNTLDK